ncbi:Fe-S-containing protein [Celerinatantimonas sp. YJH-8]|uniref:Fe-S-containing protein n=1 Tax=Celerinatantimonas sp. YJH-8 TaxID=3228714 RepID=UPI0038C14430
MSFYLSQVVSHFLLIAVFMGVLWADVKIRRYRAQFWLFVIAVVAGATLYLSLPYSQIYVLSASAIYAVLLCLLGLVNLFFKPNSQILLYGQSLLVLLASFMWARVAKLGMLSVTSVINTDLILNAAALVGGFVLILFAQLLTTLSASWRSRRFNRIFSFVLLIIALLPLSGELLLAGMKLQLIGLYRELLSYVSKVTNFYWLYAYVVLILAILLAALFVIRNILPAKRHYKSMARGVEQRKQHAHYQSRLHLFQGYALTLVLVLASISYWDLVASRPPTRSAALPVELAADHAVHIPIEKPLLDGKLHRYQWVASDGKVVRFFIIDRYPGQQKFGVVFDACRLCGDAGYIQQGTQVICLACGVHIFIPSIGRAGGCNPIPIEKWTMQDNQIVISQKMLESGLQFFSEVVEITATDPVNGDHVSNLKAPFNYMYAGKTYFFTTQGSYDKFRDNPEQYIASEQVGG